MIINYAKIVDRLERIRKALSFSIIAVLAVTVALYIKADVLVGLLTKPLGVEELVFLTPMEGLITKVKIAFFSALALCLPLIIWQFTRMASPLLPEKQRKAVYCRRRLPQPHTHWQQIFLIPVTVNLCHGASI